MLAPTSSKELRSSLKKNNKQANKEDSKKDDQIELEQLEESSSDILNQINYAKTTKSNSFDSVGQEKITTI